MKTYKIYFPETDFPPLEVNAEVPLSQQLTVENSPVAFGCCQGICGTCMSKITPLDEPPESPSMHEQETLTMMAPNHPHARLTCQLRLHGDVELSVLKWVG